ncbi:MAG: hypothetical protein A2X12_01030 [Bacteroidetes bacterium GWE2_29_8]|nr:MAG: hypothetical protein A2X12_01030 [Bacteroidetes bacterium GWE2_29_8]OFY14397.1 MAG: hypothetical protein A2X02_01165 [Bacteroidetes bacterium GWF2_29_10]
MNELIDNKKGRFSNLIIFLSIFVIFVVIGSVLSIIISKSSFFENLNYINNLKLTQLVLSLFIFILPSIFFSFIINKNPLSYFHLNKTANLKVLLLVFLFCLFIIPVINYLSELNNSISFGERYKSIEMSLRSNEKNAEEISKMFLSSTTLLGFFINILIIAIIPAIGEELFFRGTIQKLLQNISNNHHLAILLTGLIFGLVHFQFFSLVPRIILGIYLGYLFYWFNSLWVPILSHFLNNFLVVLYSYCVNIGILSESFVVWENNKIVITLIHLFLSFVILFIVYKNKEKLSEL